MKKYYPILLSKAGELTALSNLSENVKTEIAPVLQILDGTLSNVESFLIDRWNFESNSIYLDLSLYENLEDEIVSIRDLFQNLVDNDIHLTPVIQENSPNSFIEMIRDFATTNSLNVCIRVSNETGGFINFTNRINSMLNNLGFESSNISLLLDLGYAQNHNYNTLATVAILTIQTLLQNNSNWENIILSSGSFPENLNGFVPNNVYHIDRYEWQVWNLIQSEENIREFIKYSDYGTKNPIYSETNFLGTSSIKYTTENHFVIYRGELPQNNPLGMGQYIEKGSQLIQTSDYSGNEFSWGDKRIYDIVQENNRPGNPRTWVEISQNHHITLLHNLL